MKIKRKWKWSMTVLSLLSVTSKMSAATEGINSNCASSAPGVCNADACHN